MSCREITSWIEALGTSVDAKATDMMVEMVLNVSVDSLPPAHYFSNVIVLPFGWEQPLRMAAFPDLTAREVMLAMTSGRASKMIRRTPIGQVLLSRIKPSSSLVFKVVLFTEWVGRLEKPCTTA